MSGLRRIFSLAVQLCKRTDRALRMMCHGRLDLDNIVKVCLYLEKRPDKPENFLAEDKQHFASVSISNVRALDEKTQASLRSLIKAFFENQRKTSAIDDTQYIFTLACTDKKGHGQRVRFSPRYDPEKNLVALLMKRETPALDEPTAVTPGIKSPAPQHT